jgi:serine/threonine protein kinase
MNRYQVHHLFAHGAQARLFRATDVVTGERCLLKVGEASHEEAFLALDLNHPFIQTPIDIGILPAIGRFAAYRECADPPFLTWLQKRPKDEDFLRVILQMTEFLSFLHHRGFLHNDFKPDHFLIGQEEIKVIDLGLCSGIRENVMPERFSGTFLERQAIRSHGIAPSFSSIRYIM